MRYEQLPTSAEIDAAGRETRHDGEVWVRYGVEQGFERAWFSLAADDTLTVRSERGGRVLRTASVHGCQVSSVESPAASPYEAALSVTLRQDDSEGCRVYVISSGILPDSTVDAGRDPSAHVEEEFQQHPVALRQWKEAFSAAACRTAGAWKWHFAVVFGLCSTDGGDSNEDGVDGMALAKDELQQLVENWCISFHKWHFEVAVAERTGQTKDRIIILLRMDDCQIEKYFRVIEIERWRKSADGIVLRRSSSRSDVAIEVHMTQQDRVATMAYVLS